MTRGQQPLAKTLRAKMRTGGVRLPSRQAMSLRSRVMPTPLPPQLCIPLQAANTAAATPVVNPGETVTQYALLARGTDHGVAAVYAPTSGRVIAVRDIAVTVAPESTQQLTCLLFEPDPQGESAVVSGHDYRELTRDALIKEVSRAGIVDNAYDPRQPIALAQLIDLANAEPVECLLINAVDDDPYMTTAAALTREYAEQVVRGACILQLATGAARCVIAVSSAHHDCLAAIEGVLSGSALELVSVPARFPAAEHGTLIASLISTVPSSAPSPIAAGMLMLSAHTAFAADNAVTNGVPCVSRVLTLTGEGLLTPKNFFAPFGTPLSHLLALCGDKGSKTVIAQSAMHGFPLQSLDEPVQQRSIGVIACGEDELTPTRAPQPCIQCGECVAVCPRPLLPNQLLRSVQSRDWWQLSAQGLPDCIECGACSYVCPSQLPLLETFRAGKETLQQRADDSARSQYWQQRFNAHQQREENERARQLEAQRLRKLASEQQKEEAFSRTRAKSDIAAAVARVKARRDAASKSADSNTREGN